MGRILRIISVLLIMYAVTSVFSLSAWLQIIIAILLTILLSIFWPAHRKG
jgi:uncharacterized protein (DUF983 family)